MKKQQLNITITDHRNGDGEARTRTKRYSSHKDYLQDMRAIMKAEGHVHVQVNATVQVHPEEDGQLFEDQYM